MTGTVTRIGTTSQHSGKSSTARAAEGEAMLADQVNGMRQTEMMAKYGVSRATLARRLKAALDVRLPATAEARREQLNAALDDQAAEWQRNLDAGTRLAASASTRDPDTGEEVIDSAVLERGLAIRAAALAGRARVDERRAKLNGTDAPVKVESEVVVVTAQERELRDLLEQAAREQAASEAALIREDA
jgi:hypothetical protein